MQHQTTESLEQALSLRQALWETGIAYGDPPRLWRVAPRWYHLWPNQWEQIQELGRLLPILRSVLDGETSATYLRADFVIGRSGEMVLAEINDVPVWDFGTQAVRQVYQAVLGLPPKTADPFPGAAKAIAALLLRHFFGRRLVILLSPDRLKYAAEYRCLARYFSAQGIGAVVTGDAANLRSGDVVYRTFNRFGLDSGSRLTGADKLNRLYQAGQISIWPPFTKMEDKVWMSYLSEPQTDNNHLSGFSGADFKALKKFVPPTWLVDPAARGLPGKGGRVLTWHSNELMGDLTMVAAKKGQPPVRLDWVLKKVSGAQGKGTAFSSLIGPEAWRGRLLEALLGANGHGPQYVIQPEAPTLRHRLTCLDENGRDLVERSDLRVRLCVTYLLEGDQVEIIDSDATLLDRPLVHGSSDAVSLPVVLRLSK